MLSLDGKRLWVLVLAPWPRERAATAGVAGSPLVGLPANGAPVVPPGVMRELSPGLVGCQAPTMAGLVAVRSCRAIGQGWTMGVAAVRCAVLLRLAWRRFAGAP
jgi:hypothetical protein